MGRTNTYWVSFTWTYLLWMEVEEGEWGWEEVDDCDAGRFRCPKSEIKHEVEEYVKQELQYDKYKNLKVTIEDFYITSDEEL